VYISKDLLIYTHPINIDKLNKMDKQCLRKEVLINRSWLKNKNWFKHHVYISRTVLSHVVTHYIFHQVFTILIQIKIIIIVIIQFLSILQIMWKDQTKLKTCNWQDVALVKRESRLFPEPTCPTLRSLIFTKINLGKKIWNMFAEETGKS